MATTSPVLNEAALDPSISREPESTTSLFMGLVCIQMPFRLVRTAQRFRRPKLSLDEDRAPMAAVVIQAKLDGGLSTGSETTPELCSARRRM